MKTPTKIYSQNSTSSKRNHFDYHFQIKDVQLVGCNAAESIVRYLSCFAVVYRRVRGIWGMIFRGNREGVAFDHGISRYEHPSMPVSIIHPLPAIPGVQNVAGVRRGTVLIIHRSNYKGPTDHRSISQESFHRYIIPVPFLLRSLCIEIHLLARSKLLKQRWNTFKFSILLPRNGFSS